MPFYDCHGCGAVFHHPGADPYVSCGCGETLESATAILPALPELRRPRVEVLKPGGVTELSRTDAAVAPRSSTGGSRYRVKRKRRPV